MEFDREIVAGVSGRSAISGHTHMPPSQLVRRYLFGSARPPRKKSIFSLRKKWSYRDVVQDKHRAEINKLAAELSGSGPGSLDYLSQYKAAFATVEGSLTDEVRMKYRADAITWSDEKPPASVQYRYVHANCSGRWQVTKPYQTSTLQKHSLQAFREFTESVYTQFGMRIVIMAGYEDRSGHPEVVLYV